MVTKKKLEYGELHGWHWFIPLFVMPCVLLFVMFSSNSYAMTSQEIDVVVNDFLTNSGTTSQQYNLRYCLEEKTSWGDFIFSSLSDSQLDYIENSEIMFIYNYPYNGGQVQFLFFHDNNIQSFFTVNSSYVYFRGYKHYSYFSWEPNSNAINFTADRNNNRITDLYSTDNLYYGISTIPIYTSENGTIIDNNYYYVYDYTPAPQNSITLTSTSLSKFSYSDFNQCVVNITGDWTFEDFVFYVERYINDEWVEYVPPNENFVIYGYENPWYVTWNDINYWQVGTYRYVADYHSLGNDLFYSSAFNISGSVVDNGATGTIDDGNIDIDIDTGKTVDDIKDFMGSPADFDNAKITQNDIENALNIEETINPYENFVLTLINGLTSSLTGNTSTSWTFKVHSWGETFTFYPSDVIPQYSQGLRDFLTIISTTFCVIVIVRWVTQIVESVNVGDVSKSLELIEEKYSDLL